MAKALSSPLDPLLHERLSAHRNHLLDYPDFPFEELGLFLIVQPGDTLDTVATASPVRLAQESTFTFEPETIDHHGDWLEVLFVMSDDGFGIVLFVSLVVATDPDLLSACQALAPNLELPGSR